MSLGEFVSDAWHCIQGELFPFLAEEVGLLGERHRRFVAVPGLARVGRHLHYDHRGVGHPPADRNALARALLARAVWDLPTTAALIDRLPCDPTPRAVRPVAACRRSPARRRSHAPSRGSRRPGFRSGCAGRWSGPRTRDRSSAMSPGIPRRSWDGSGRRPSRSGSQGRSGGAVARGKVRGRSGSRRVRAAAAGRHVHGADGGGAAEDPRRRHQAERQRLQRKLAWVQNAYRRRRRRRPRQLYPHLGVAARQPGRDPARPDDRGAGGPPPRADGRGLRLPGDRRPRPHGGAGGDNRRQPPPGRGAQGAPRRGGLGPAQGGPRPPRPRAPPAAPGVERVNSALRDSYGQWHFF